MASQFEVQDATQSFPLVGAEHRTSRASKSWLAADARTLSYSAGAVQPGVSADEAMSIVKAVTRFATVMCVFIACVKVWLYFKTGQEVVRTSALDSLGDLLANCMTLYTGYRMTLIDTKRYPVGQGKFQSIGCLVFSTFMFALMFGNSLGNIESLIESKDEIGYAAISRFFYQTEDLGGSFTDWHKEVSWDKSEEAYEWNTTEDGALKIATPMKGFFAKQALDPDNEQAESEEKMGKALPDTMTRGEIAHETAEYQNQEEQRDELAFQSIFLGICATYKCCLWLFCIFYAIPKTGSGVLVALATDKRNDFVGTFSVIIATNVAFKSRATLNDMGLPEEKVDPLVSFVLSAFIMYSWSGLMIEHMTLLSQEAAQDDFVAGVKEEVKKVVQASPCRAPESGTVVFLSSDKHTIEVEIVAQDATSSWEDVSSTAAKVKRKLEQIEDVERVIVKFP